MDQLTRKLFQIRLGVSLAVMLVVAGCAQSQLLEQLYVDSDAVKTGANAASYGVSPASGEIPSRQQEMGDELAQRALAVLGRSSDTELEEYLNAIVQRLKNTTAHNNATVRYQVYLVDSPQANAFTPGGGHIFVTTGIVTKLRTEAQMAMVLAHEMAHNKAEHVVKGHDGQNLSNSVAAFGKKVFDDGLGVPWLSSGVKALADTSLNSYTRAQEEEADLIGLSFFVAAGYDPNEAPRSFAALIPVDAQKKSIFDVFDGYPQGIRRAQTMNALVHTNYRGVDTARLTRNSDTYSRLASAYWQ